VRFSIVLKVPKSAQFIDAGVSSAGPGTSEVHDVVVSAAEPQKGQ
jgi:hypothetical protein